MHGIPTSFWAKLRKDVTTGALEWHPLADHCADVAAVAEALLALPVWRQRLSRLAGQPLNELVCARLCVLAALHDIGKLNLGFQAKGRPGFGSPAGHVKPALGELFRPRGTFSCLDELARWGNGTTALLVSAICHHGQPYNADYADGPEWRQAKWWTPQFGLDPKSGADAILSKCRHWFPLAFFADSAPLPESASFSHAFAGLVTLADWIGSDTRYFQFSESDEIDRMTVARIKAAEAIRAMALHVPRDVRTDGARRDSFARIAPPGYVPRSMQAGLVALPRDQNGSITILESETGSGKTEAVLARFLSLFEAGLVDGLYFALPTRSAATEMHRRVREAAQRAFVDPPAVVLAVPGYLRIDEVEGQRLPPFEVLWPDGDRFRYRAWAAENPKRFLAGCIVVGTIDQVLLSSLMVGHCHLRAAALLRHMLVIDEVHASDAYMTAILEHVLARHLSAGGHALLLSATLGGETRGRLLRPAGPVIVPSIDEAQGAPYPLITHRGDTEQTVASGSDLVTRAIELDIRSWLEDPQALADDALRSAMAGAKVLVIRNTVNDCVRTQLAIEQMAPGANQRNVLFTCKGSPAPHHARYGRPDRQALDLALEARLGKQRLPGGCVVVATQTVQQSLDLDADVLFSDLCPMDVLLQRLGRLHRHQRSRPAAFQKPRAVVVVPPRRDLTALLGDKGVPRNYHGLGRVYPDLRILEATWRAIETHREWRVPEMCRHLVESSVHSTVLAGIVQEGGSRWLAHANYLLGTERGHHRQAELNIVDWSMSYAELSFPSSVDQRITTRLGEGDRLVRFPDTFIGPFGLHVEELVLPDRWTRDVAPEHRNAEGVTSADGSVRFRFGERFFVYDRLGLRPDATQVKASP